MPTKKEETPKKKTVKKTDTTKTTTKKGTTKKTAVSKPVQKKILEEIEVTELEMPVATPEPTLKEEKKESYVGLKLLLFVLILLLIALGAYAIYDSIFANKDENTNSPVCTEPDNTTSDDTFSTLKYVKDSVIDNNKVVFDYICTSGKDCNKELIQAVMDDEVVTFDIQYKSQTTNEINAGELKIEANKKMIISEDIIGGAHVEYFKTYLNRYFVVVKSYSDNRMVTKIYDKDGRMITEINSLKGNFYGLEGINFYEDKIVYFTNDATYNHVAMHMLNVKDGMLDKDTKVETDLNLK